MKPKIDFKNFDFKKAGKVLAIVAAGGMAIINEITCQKEKAELEEMKKTIEFLKKGKES
jgi:hypothetical protein